MRTSVVGSIMPTQINPCWLDAAGYIAFLNRVFPGQWNRVAYDWYMGRVFNGVGSDILVRADGSRILAGMALCYRQVAIQEGKPIEVGVITAAATLPGEQGRGHYSALVRSVIGHGRERGCAAVLGFVTRHNPSGRGLMRTGALAIPSFYIVSRDVARNGRGAHEASRSSRGIGAAAREREVALDPGAIRLVQRSFAVGGDRVPHARFHYEHEEDWGRQFIERPHGVRAVRLAHDSLALIETVRGTDRLQMLVCPDRKRTRSIGALTMAGAAAGRQFFMYTLDPLEAAAARRMGLRIRGGYLMVQPTGYSTAAWSALAGAVWSVESGDRV